MNTGIPVLSGKIYKRTLRPQSSKATPATQFTIANQYSETTGLDPLNSNHINIFHFVIRKSLCSNSFMNSIAQNIQDVRERIANAAEKCGRSPQDITLIAVSKTFPKEAIENAAMAGLRSFGENRIQEAQTKIPQLSEIHDIEWHLVGHLQTNKAKRAAELFDMIHSLDSFKLAIRLNEASIETGKVMSVLLQIDLGGEETKYGADPDRIRDIIAAMPDFKGLRLNGLMTIPPFLEDPEGVRPYFARLRELGQKLESEQRGCLGLKHLSMGMSHDFEQAIQEGATMVRVGTAIFGSRQ
jgi:PLP dependent protein